jgi:PEGA domain
MLPQPSPLSLQASMTSSGFADGLGRRTLAFDREEGVMLERLVLRPELGAFESMLRERLDSLGTLEDERIARPRTIERDVDGSLVVVSEFVPGSRLAELLDTAAETGTAPGMDAALGFLLDLLPALCGLHAGARFAHGSISPSRTVLTPAGQIVLLDAIYGGALPHLRYSRRKLWTEFAVATSPRLPARRLHVETDLAQAALAAVMLVLGRPLTDDEYPENLASVVGEVCDVAQIRGSADFASSVRLFLHRALQLHSSDAYSSADDALFDVREVASELGLHVCRRALVDFIEQMESPTQPRRTDQHDDLADEIARFRLAAACQDVADVGEQEQDLDAHVDAELDIDRLVEGGDDGHHDITEVDIPASTTLGEEAVDWVAAAAESSREEAARLAHAPDPAPAIPLPAIALSAWEPELPAAEPLPALEPVIQVAAPAPEAVLEAAPFPVPSAPEETVAPDLETHGGGIGPTLVATGGGTDGDHEAPASEEITEAVPAVRSRRAKRATRSARARKDKLRSAAEHDVPPVLTLVEPPAPLPPPPPPSLPNSSSWLVAPGQAAAFEPPVMEATPPAPVFVPIQPQASTEGRPATPQFALAPPVPIYIPPPLPPAPVVPPPLVEPVFSRTVGAIAPSYDAPPTWTPAPAPPPPPAPVSVVRPQAIVPIKLKESGSRSRAARSETTIDIYSTPLPAVDTTTTPAAFPWKMVAALAVIVVGAIIGGRVYLPAKGAASEEEVAAPVASAAPAAAAATPPVTPNATRGRIEIETQPAGARVLLDGKPAGDSPLALDGVAAGRHTITLISASGSIKRTIRVEAGRITKLDIPIFSGWVGIFAPFVVEVSEGGKPIGTTEESRLMMSPGRHELTLVNQELGYRASRTVDIEPGEVRSITLDPRGEVNFNASPWAEVFVDGRKVGDTPIANLQLPLGIRDVTFRHPQFGERRMPLTVKGDSPSAISIDFTKPPVP